GLVLVDAAQNKLAWGHWEQGANGPLAVFRYSVPKENSHYEVRYCCVAASYGMESNSFNVMSGYHGEMAVDPASGVIVRVTLQAELSKEDPSSRADLAVEYGPVELGGTQYICPQRSVSISMARTIRQMQAPRRPAAGEGGTAASFDSEPPEISTAEATALPEGPAQTAEQASDVRFRINARLVYVNVVALDKKGRPIVDLKPEVFEIYDDG